MRNWNDIVSFSFIEEGKGLLITYEELKPYGFDATSKVVNSSLLITYEELKLANGAPLMAR